MIEYKISLPHDFSHNTSVKKKMFKSSLTLLASPSDSVKRDENSVAMTILEGIR